MNALLIHHDGRAEAIFGHISGDLTTIAVLTQSALSALDAASAQSGHCSINSVQLQQGPTQITLLRMPNDSWLRVSHEQGATVDQVRQWAAHNAKSSSPKEPAPNRTQSLMDALHAAQPM